jgi:hypothetical protein
MVSCRLTGLRAVEAECHDLLAAIFGLRVA